MDLSLIELISGIGYAGHPACGQEKRKHPRTQWMVHRRLKMQRICFSRS
jgi:hypothetical protein